MNIPRVIDNLKMLRDEPTTDDERHSIACKAIETILELSIERDYYEGKADAMEQVFKIIAGKA